MAVKIVVADTLDCTVLQEVLTGPHLAHDNVVRTCLTRVARLSDQYFDFVEAHAATAAIAKRRPRGACGGSFGTSAVRDACGPDTSGGGVRGFDCFEHDSGECGELDSAPTWEYIVQRPPRTLGLGAGRDGAHGAHCYPRAS